MKTLKNIATWNLNMCCTHACMQHQTLEPNIILSQEILDYAMLSLNPPRCTNLEITATHSKYVQRHNTGKLEITYSINCRIYNKPRECHTPLILLIAVILKI